MWLIEILSLMFRLTADATIDEIVRSQISHQASIPMSRQPAQRHILEVSAAQQRQQDVLLQARKHVRALALHATHSPRRNGQKPLEQWYGI